MLNVLEEIDMVNQIHDSGGIKAMEIDSHLKPRNQEKKESVVQTQVSADKVNFSDTSKQLEALKTSFKNVPEIDQQKVARFKAEIDAGSYEINSSEIAKRMLENIELF